MLAAQLNYKMMNYYNTSKDYAKLFEIVNAGNVVAGFVKEGYLHGGALKDVVKITKRTLDGIIIGCRGIEYNGTYNDSLEDFIAACTACGLEWITNNQQNAYGQ